MTKSTGLKSRARQTLERIKSETGSDSILCGVSGKDSLVVLDMATSIFKNVEGFFWYLVKGLRCTEPPLKYARKKYKIKIHQVPRPMLVNCFKNGQMMPRYFEAEDFPTLRQKDLERVLRRRTGIEYIAYGHRMADSLERRGMLSVLDAGIDRKGKRVYPIWDWKKADVQAYVRSSGMPVMDMLGGQNMSGVVLTAPKRIIHIRRHYPDDYEKIKEVFPWIDALVKRHEWQESKKPEVQDAKGRTKRNQKRAVQPASD